jgi:hypothetical protein
MDHRSGAIEKQRATLLGSEPLDRTAAIVLIISSLAVFAAVCWYRDTGYGGPHHDEVIALLASKGLEREYSASFQVGDAPFDRVVPAADWHRFTKDFSPVPFDEIRRDVQECDLHPPLAFWFFNRWLSLFPEAGYEQAVVLTWLQMVVAAGLLAALAFRMTGSPLIAAMAFTLFLFGNSAVFTAVWVRQYAWFAVCYAALMLLAGELSRRGLRIMPFVGVALSIGLVSCAGMLTQYTFAIMSAPIHIALVTLFSCRRQWSRLGILASAYILAALAFFALHPGAIRHALSVSSNLERRVQVSSALESIPQMLIPWPATLPSWLTATAGGVVFAVILLMGIAACRDGQSDRTFAARVILSGMLGAGVLQFIMVAAGYFPPWGTGPNHFCAFWLLTVFAAVLLLDRLRNVWILPGFSGMLVFMLVMQTAFAWHCHRLVPRKSVSYVSTLSPALVCADDLARGMVLELTDVMPAEQRVLVTETQRLIQQFSSGQLHQYPHILYLPMLATSGGPKRTVIHAAEAAGWTCNELPVIHSGLYDAVLIQRTASARGQ